MRRRFPASDPGSGWEQAGVSPTRGTHSAQPRGVASPRHRSMPSNQAAGVASGDLGPPAAASIFATSSAVYGASSYSLIRYRTISKRVTRSSPKLSSSRVFSSSPPRVCGRENQLLANHLFGLRVPCCRFRRATSQSRAPDIGAERPVSSHCLWLFDP